MTQAETVKQLVQEKKDVALGLAQDIWSYAELAYEETKSADALCAALEQEGFSLQRGGADMPTSIIASYRVGSGAPVMGILGEYDALDALSQKAASPSKEPLCCGAPGHGCGHNLLGAGSCLAAIALKEYLLREKLDGTVIFFGCPAEEGAGAKQFMARAGCFDGVDFVYTWHPATVNMVQADGNVAIMGANFIFDGIAAHAGGSPHLGRSALDATELMNVGVNYLREHMLDAARVHYAYSDAGGTAPNVVQHHTVIKYEVRAPKVTQVQELFARVVNIAKGAALMTDTKVRYEITMAFSDYTPNMTLAGVADACMKEIGAPQWSAADDALALEFLRTYPNSTLKSIREELLDYFPAEAMDEVLKTPLDRQVHDFAAASKRYTSGSTDVGDVGYVTPTVNLLVATACLGNVGHSWQNTAFSNSPIGMKGMETAAADLVLCCLRTREQPELIQRAKAEVQIKNGGHYVCPLPDYVKPPVGNY